MDTKKTCNWSLKNSHDEQTEENICERFSLVMDSFGHMENLSKSALMRKIFSDIFELVFEAEKGSLLELTGNRYIATCSKGYDEAIMSKLSFKVDETFMNFAYSQNEGIVAKQIHIKSRDPLNIDLETLEILKELGIYENFTTFYCPLLVDEIIVGMICLDNFTNHPFSRMSEKTLKFYAQMISSYLTQQVHQEQINRVNIETVKALVSAIEVNDQYSEGHGKRVGYYAKELETEMGFSENDISDIETAGLLHDIGKLGIPTDILNKPEKLSEVEYGIIRKHPSNTRKILKNVKGLNKISEYTYYHHEHFDGNGYPSGLNGDQFPYASQIISIVDAFDAMTSDRAYRKALSVDEAIEIIHSHSGRKFEPRLTQVATMILPRLFQEMNLEKK